jgi:hypothetical protein
MATEENELYTLTSLEDFKALAGVDDREDKISQFCLVTATNAIEQFCNRRFLTQKHSEFHEWTGSEFLYLQEYPVRKIIAALAVPVEPGGRFTEGGEKLIGTDLFRVVPNCDSDKDYPYYIQLCDFLTYNVFSGYRVIYRAGYDSGKVPADLVSACFELSVWNMNRYRGKRIGMTGNIRGAGKEGEHFETSMPENVRSLLEPYRRKTI